MGGFFDYGRVSLYNCFDPHHRVEITHADGTVTRLDICFQCRQLLFDHERLQPIPTLMRSRLEQLFASVGMKLKDPQEYYELGSKH